MYARICASKSPAEQLYNGHCLKFLEGGDHVSPWNGIYNADKFCLFDLNVKNKPTSSESNASIGLLKRESE